MSKEIKIENEDYIAVFEIGDDTDCATCQLFEKDKVNKRVVLLETWSNDKPHKVKITYQNTLTVDDVKKAYMMEAENNIHEIINEIILENIKREYMELHRHKGGRNDY